MTDSNDLREGEVNCYKVTQLGLRLSHTSRRRPFVCVDVHTYEDHTSSLVSSASDPKTLSLLDPFRFTC